MFILFDQIRFYVGCIMRTGRFSLKATYIFLMLATLNTDLYFKNLSFFLFQNPELNYLKIRKVRVFLIVLVNFFKFKTILNNSCVDCEIPFLYLLPSMQNNLTFFY
jgi:hypothetical protein